MPIAKIDPELIRQIDGAGDAPVGAVFNLRRASAHKSLTAEETETCVKRMLQQVQKQSGLAPQQIHVFRNLGAFSVSAPALFMRKLLDQDEVLSATANRQPEELLIKPVEVKPVKGPGARKHK
jgi:hypothetical protein